MKYVLEIKHEPYKYDEYKPQIHGEFGVRDLVKEKDKKIVTYPNRQKEQWWATQKEAIDVINMYVRQFKEETTYETIEINIPDNIV